MMFQQLHKLYSVECRKRRIMNEEFRWMWKNMAYVKHMTMTSPLNPS
jgi:hypothetical protein